MVACQELNSIVLDGHLKDQTSGSLAPPAGLHRPAFTTLQAPPAQATRSHRFGAPTSVKLPRSTQPNAASQDGKVLALSPCQTFLNSPRVVATAAVLQAASAAQLQVSAIALLRTHTEAAEAVDGVGRSIGRSMKTGPAIPEVPGRAAQCSWSGDQNAQPQQTAHFTRSRHNDGCDQAQATTWQLSC